MLHNPASVDFSVSDFLLCRTRPLPSCIVARRPPIAQLLYTVDSVKGHNPMSTVTRPMPWYARRADVYQQHFPSDYPASSALAPLLSPTAFERLIDSLNAASLWEPACLTTVAVSRHISVAAFLVWVVALLALTLGNSAALGWYLQWWFWGLLLLCFAPFVVMAVVIRYSGGLVAHRMGAVLTELSCEPPYAALCCQLLRLVTVQRSGRVTTAVTWQLLFTHRGASVDGAMGEHTVKYETENG